MSPAFPLLGLLGIHQPDIRLVHQRRGLKRVARILLGYLPGRKPAQLVVDQRQEPLGGPSVALLDGTQDPSDVGHRHAPWRDDDAHDYSGSVTQ